MLFPQPQSAWRKLVAGVEPGCHRGKWGKKFKQCFCMTSKTSLSNSNAVQWAAVFGTGKCSETAGLAAGGFDRFKMINDTLVTTSSVVARCCQNDWKTVCGRVTLLLVGGGDKFTCCYLLKLLMSWEGGCANIAQRTWKPLKPALIYRGCLGGYHQQYWHCSHPDDGEVAETFALKCGCCLVLKNRAEAVLSVYTDHEFQRVEDLKIARTMLERGELYIWFTNSLSEH